MFHIGKPTEGAGSAVIQLPIPHVRQTTSWNCGIACITMVFKWRGNSATPLQIEAFMKAKDIDESVWTIDMCYILSNFGVKTELTTKTLGADPAYASDPFYQKDFDADAARVNKLFDQASTLGFNVRKRTLSLADIAAHLHTGGVCIVLLNASVYRNQLTGKTHQHDHVDGGSASVCCCAMGDHPPKKYQGHYVVVCGVDPPNKKVYFTDPAYNENLSKTSYAVFDAARSADGTDDDVILVPPL